MKKYILISLAAALLHAGCEKEEKLTPTNIEVAWCDYLDLSNPLVKQFYQEYGVGLLTEFDENRDFRYQIERYWDVAYAPKIEDENEKEQAFGFVQESLLSYFTNKQFIRDHFPRMMLLCSDIILGNTGASNNNLYNPFIEESDSSIRPAINSIHSIFNPVSFALACKLETIYYNETNYNNYMRDNMYNLLICIFERSNLYNQLGPDFYLPDMAQYYGIPLVTAYEDDREMWQQEEKSAITTSKYWYWNKGFVSTVRLIPVLTGSLADQIYFEPPTVAGAINHDFPFKERELRSIINQMIYVTPTLYDSYPDIVKGRFAAMMAKFDEWGIDIRRFNPTMEYAFPRN